MRYGLVEPLPALAATVAGTRPVSVLGSGCRCSAIWRDLVFDMTSPWIESGQWDFYSFLFVNSSKATISYIKLSY
jgi:hypothetical protein